MINSYSQNEGLPNRSRGGLIVARYLRFAWWFVGTLAICMGLGGALVLSHSALASADQYFASEVDSVAHRVSDQLTRLNRSAWSVLRETTVSPTSDRVSSELIKFARSDAIVEGASLVDGSGLTYSSISRDSVAKSSSTPVS